MLGRNEQSARFGVLAFLVRDRVGVEGVRMPARRRQTERRRLVGDDLDGMRRVRVRNLAQARNAACAGSARRPERRTRPAVHDVDRRHPAVGEPSRRGDRGSGSCGRRPARGGEPGARRRRASRRPAPCPGVGTETGAVERDVDALERRLANLVVGRDPDARLADSVGEAVQDSHGTHHLLPGARGRASVTHASYMRFGATSRMASKVSTIGQQSRGGGCISSKPRQESETAALQLVSLPADRWLGRAASFEVGAVSAGVRVRARGRDTWRCRA